MATNYDRMSETVNILLILTEVSGIKDPVLNLMMLGG
jgi:hypothetical protein